MRARQSLWPIKLEDAQLIVALCLVLHTYVATGTAQETLVPKSNNTTESETWQNASALAPGILYQKIVREEPRAIHAHVVRIDSKTEGLRFYTTVPCENPVAGKEETKRETVRDFIRRSQSTNKKLILAINADFFQPWPVPFSREDRTDLGGLAISEGALVSEPAATPSFLVMRTNEVRMRVVNKNEPLDAVRTAVSGFAFCLQDGKVQPSGDDLHPRTGIGLSEDNRMVFWIVVDGRQKESLGVTTSELGSLLLEFGAHHGINMDGGGSSTLARWNENSTDADKCELLNRPVGNGRRYMTDTDRYSPSERANGNNLGVYFER